MIRHFDYPEAWRPSVGHFSELGGEVGRPAPSAEKNILGRTFPMPWTDRVCYCQRNDVKETIRRTLRLEWRSSRTNGRAFSPRFYPWHRPRPAGLG